MPLSDDEARALADIEAGLRDGDAKLARTLSGHGHKPAAAALGVLLTLIGLAGIIAAVPLNTIVPALLGFAVALTGATTTYRTFSRPRIPTTPGASWNTRLEQRWERRRGDTL